MDEVARDMVKAQLKSAKTPEALNDAMVSAMTAVVDCQCKTDMRVKWQGLILAGIGLQRFCNPLLIALFHSINLDFSSHAAPRDTTAASRA